MNWKKKTECAGQQNKTEKKQIQLIEMEPWQEDW